MKLSCIKPHHLQTFLPVHGSAQVLPPSLNGLNLFSNQVQCVLLMRNRMLRHVSKEDLWKPIKKTVLLNMKRFQANRFEKTVVTSQVLVTFECYYLVEVLFSRVSLVKSG